MTVTVSKLPSPMEAASEVVAFLNEHGIAYVIIGGMAVQYWGEPRLTRDVDITVLAGSKEREFLQQAATCFSPRMVEAVDFAQRSRVLLLRASNGCPIDISLGIPGYEAVVIDRGVTVTWPGFDPVKLVSCEDLIIHKCVAGRPRDLEDVEHVLIRQRNPILLSHIKDIAGIPYRRMGIGIARIMKTCNQEEVRVEFWNETEAEQFRVIFWKNSLNDGLFACNRKSSRPRWLDVITK